MDNCCLNMYVSGTMEKDQVFEWTSTMTGSYPEFQFDVDGDALSLFFNEDTSYWQVLEEGFVICETPFLPQNNECPNGLQVPLVGGDVLYTFNVYSIPCDSNPNAPTIEYPLECLEEPCRNKNLFRKQRGELAKDIAGISKKEIFGFKCGDAWENIFMRNMIIHALSCMPTGVLSIEKENCLIGKLTDKCNC